MLTPLDVSGIELFLATNFNDGGCPMRKKSSEHMRETSKRKKSDDG